MLYSPAPEFNDHFEPPAPPSAMRHRPVRRRIFTAATSKQLRLDIERLRIDVPPRDQGRTTDDCEQWQIQRLLQALFLADRLQLPVQLSKGESPDFLLSAGAHDMGIETTEAVNPDYVRATMHPKARIPGSLVDPSLYKWGAEGRPRQQIAEEAGRTRLTGDGWAGDSVEQDFTASVVDVTHRKSLKLRSHYERFDCDRLLIYQNQTLPCLDIEQARRSTEAALARYWRFSGFHTVHVDDGDSILEFTATGSRVL